MNADKFKIGVLASHQGTNFQAILDACRTGSLDASIELLVCNNSSAPVIDRAKRDNIPVRHFSSKTHPDPNELDETICAALNEKNVDLVVLAGYMKKLGTQVLETYRDRIINVHPSLLPKHGGQGFFGKQVHEAVLNAGDQITGATVHLVTAGYDEGSILAQQSIEVRSDDTTDSLAERLRPIEHKLLTEVIQRFREESST